LDSATVKADQQFAMDTIIRGYSGTFANRFHVQLEPGGTGAILGIGSTGILAGTTPDGEVFVNPVATVNQSFRVDQVFLRSLAETIYTLLPKQEAEAVDVNPS